MCNVEIKAKVNDYEKICKLAEEISGRPPKIIKQDDTFYKVPNGRLKMRFFPDNAATLIRYSREDTAGPRRSNYQLLEFAKQEYERSELLDDMLRRCIGIRGRVIKERRLYRVGQTRVHIDTVDELGHFMELEVTLNPGQSFEEGHAIAKDLQTKLGVHDDDLITHAYVDLLDEVI